MGCLIGVDLLTKAIAVHVLRGEVELDPGASLQLLLRVNESGMGTLARAVAGGSSAAQRVAGSIAWFALTIYLVATRRTQWALRLKVLVGCAIFAAFLTGGSLARSIFEQIPSPILAAMARIGSAVFMTYLWTVIRPGLWRTAAMLFAAAALGNLLGLIVHPDGVVDFIYSRFITAILHQGVSNVADLYYDAAVVCLVAAGVRTIAARAAVG
jgi:lipoprotein signal peptidase